MSLQPLPPQPRSQASCARTSVKTICKSPLNNKGVTSPAYSISEELKAKKRKSLHKACKHSWRVYIWDATFWTIAGDSILFRGKSSFHSREWPIKPRQCWMWPSTLLLTQSSRWPKTQRTGRNQHTNGTTQTQPSSDLIYHNPNGWGQRTSRCWCVLFLLRVNSRHRWIYVFPPFRLRSSQRWPAVLFLKKKRKKSGELDW